MMMTVTGSCSYILSVLKNAICGASFILYPYIYIYIYILYNICTADKCNLSIDGDSAQIAHNNFKKNNQPLYFYYRSKASIDVFDRCLCFALYIRIGLHQPSYFPSRKVFLKTDFSLERFSLYKNIRRSKNLYEVFRDEQYRGG